MISRFGSVARAPRSQAFALRSFSASSAAEPIVLVEKREADRVAVVTLNRPKALNALCDELISALNIEMKKLDLDPSVGAIVLTGSKKAFAAGADIKEMQPKNYITCYTENTFSDWSDLTKIQTPTIAAVNGFALGGGCELSMMCDIVLASETAKFGQPEIKLGTIPGCGGTQRLVRAVGKSKAMELILTGDLIDANEALASGLVARVYSSDDLLPKAIEMATKIGAYSKPIVQMAKEAVNASYELTLKEGERFERRIFHSTFSTKDRLEGMTAFVEKRAPKFVHE